MSWLVYTTYRLMISSAPPVSLILADLAPPPFSPQNYEVMPVKFEIWDPKMDTSFWLFRDLFLLECLPFQNFWIRFCIWQTDSMKVQKILERNVKQQNELFEHFQSSVWKHLIPIKEFFVDNTYNFI